MSVAFSLLPVAAGAAIIYHFVFDEHSKYRSVCIPVLEQSSQVQRLLGMELRDVTERRRRDNPITQRPEKEHMLHCFEFFVAGPLDEARVYAEVIQDRIVTSSCWFDLFNVLLLITISRLSFAFLQVFDVDGVLDPYKLIVFPYRSRGHYVILDKSRKSVVNSSSSGSSNSWLTGWKKWATPKPSGMN